MIYQHVNERTKILPLATSLIVHLCNQFNHVSTRVVNGPTSSGLNPAQTWKYKPEPGPNPKINLKPKTRPKKFES